MSRNSSVQPRSGMGLSLVCTLLTLVMLWPSPAPAADLVVNSLSDAAVDGDDLCTLREAITAANSDADFNDCLGAGEFGADAITFSTSGTITLSSALPNVTDPAGLTLDGDSQVIVSGNQSVRVFFIETGASLTLLNLSVVNGLAFAGGGVNNEEGTLTIANSVLSGNSADDGGAIRSFGALTITDSTISGNSATGGRGGGIFHVSGVATIANTRFSGNDVNNSGGGIHSEGVLNVSSSTFSGNTAQSGGGLVVVAGTASVTGSTFSHNSALVNVVGGDGGGIWNEGVVTLTNSTLHGNAAFSAGGAIRNFGDLTATNVTLSGNGSIGPGGGISNSGTVLFRSSIIANSVLGANCAGNVGDGGYNIDDGATCGFSAASQSLPNTDPVLDPAGPADNGGLTETIALEPTSPAIDAIPPGVNGCGTEITRDQRGFLRPQPPPPSLSNCDVGAYEVAPGLTFDFDDDGVPDDRDECPRSDLSDTVVLQTCNSGVPNRLSVLRRSGCTISDLIAKVDSRASSHGQFVRGVTHLTKALRRAGVIVAREKRAIQKCAARADSP